MNLANFEVASGLVPYIKQSQQARHQREKLIKNFFDHKKIPDEGWDDLTIQLLMTELAAMDSNNFIGKIIFI
jgi:O-phospho-L-seryl-tRNASec:L-selenocysteinyl-tRNA synthase